MAVVPISKPVTPRCDAKHDVGNEPLTTVREIIYNIIVMSKLAIKGHKERGKEVIEILEMLGGNNKHKYVTDSDCFAFYIVNETGNVYYDWVHNCYEDEDTLVFTLEEFLEKFPYKVGDKVSSKYLKNYKIEKMEWEDTDNRVIYKLQGMGWYSAEELQLYKEETMDKANKVVFEANAQCCDIMNHIIKEKAMEEIKIDIPKGYEFAGVDDNNQQVVFTKIGYHYPNTYEECCEVLGIRSDWHLTLELDTPATHDLSVTKEFDYVAKLESLRKLLICRDAYWKIAGDWEPDWEDAKQKYGLIVVSNRVEKQKSNYVQIKFCFPTEEICDAFYENFKELIEECKELI